MKRKTFSTIVGILLTFLLLTFSIAVINAQTWATGFLLSGKIVTPPSWDGGHVDNVWFATGWSFTQTDNNFTPVYFDAGGILHGNFWLGTAGWATFDHNVDGYQAEISNCKDNILKQQVQRSSQDLCYITGAAWSENAGWIILEWDKINSGSGVYFNPNTSNLEWFAWSEALGWVPMFTGKIFDECSKNPESCGDTVLPNDWYKDPVSPGSIAVNFIGKVAILGNIAGTKVFEVANKSGYKNQDVGYTYSTVQHAPILNQIRGNVARLTRNLKITDGLATNAPHNWFLYNNQKDYCLGGSNPNPCNGYSNIASLSTIPDDAKTIIVKGKDIIIDGDINNTTDNINSTNPTAMKWIIALKDDNGNGWNIYITKNASQIYAYIFAEWSIFSGEKESDGKTVKYIESGDVGTSGLPVNQLYINGIVISKNTIGWNANSNSIVSKCPIIVSECYITNATSFDWSYFRAYSDGALGAKSSLPDSRKHITDTRVKNATVIIDYNNNILKNPPVGFENFQ